MLSTIGMVIVALGIIGLIWGIMQKMKAGRVGDAPLVKTGEAAARGPAVAGPRGAISVEGNVLCQQPLTSPVTGTPCLWYSVKCTAAWKDGDREKTKELEHQKVAAQFAIDDGTGPVWIECREGGDFEPMQSKNETKSTGLIGGITGKDLEFGHYRVSTGIMSMGTKYTVEERVMPLVQRMYACGKAADGGGRITPPSWRQLLLSNKSRDEILSSATKGAKTFLIGGAAAFAAGSAMAIIGQMLGGGDASAAAATSATAAAAAAPQAADDPGAAAGSTSKAAVGKPAGAKAAGAVAPAKAAGPATGAAATPSGAAAAAPPAAPSAKPAAGAATATPAKTAAPAAPPPPKAPPPKK